MANPSGSAHGAYDHDIPSPGKTFYTALDMIGHVLLSHGVPQDKIDNGKRLIATGRLYLETIAEVLLVASITDFDPTSPISFAAKRVFAYIGRDDFSTETAIVASKYLDAIYSVLVSEIPEFAALDIDTWTPDLSVRTARFCAAALSVPSPFSDHRKNSSPFTQLTLSPTRFGVDPSAPEGFQPLTKAQLRQVNRAMEHNEKTAASRYQKITETLFDTKKKHPAGCDCDICQLLSHNSAQAKKGQRGGSTSETMSTHPAFDTFKRLWPEETVKLFLETARTGQSPWEVLSHLTAFHGHLGSNSITEVAMETVKAFWQKYAPKGAESGPMDRTENTKSYELEESEYLAQVVGMFVTRLKNAANAKAEEVKAMAEEQKLISLDSNKSAHERLIATVDHQRLLIESGNINMRINISQARMFNMENRFGCNVEMVTKVLLDHLKLPGGEDEDPVGILELISNSGLRVKESRKGYGLSLRQILNDPMVLLNQLANDTVDAPSAGPSSEKTAAPADQVAKEAPAPTEKLKKKSKKSKKGKGKGKVTEGEETPVASDEKGKAKMTEAEETAKAGSKTPLPGVEDHTASHEKGKETQKGPDPEEKVPDLRALFDRHAGNKRQTDALTKMLELNLERAEKVRVSNALLGAGGSTKLPLPPQFHFQGELVPTEGVPKKVLEAIWNLDFLLEELPKDEQKVKDLYFKVSNSLQIWAINTNDKHWESVVERIHELPLTREYMFERELLQEEVMNAHCETITIIKFLKGSKGKSVTIPDALLAKLFQFGSSLTEARAYWAAKLNDVSRGTPDELVQYLSAVRAKGSLTEPSIPATTSAHQGAAAGEGASLSQGEGEGAPKPKEWWEHVLEKQ